MTNAEEKQAQWEKELQESIRKRQNKPQQEPTDKEEFEKWIKAMTKGCCGG